MQRKWAVGPDPATGIVDRQELIEAIMDGEALLWRAGGVLSIIVGRHPTNLPGEMVTTGAVIEWKDRTDARPQPERAGDVVAPVAASPEPPEPELPATDEEIRDELAFLDTPDDDVGDGLDPSTLEAEDLTSVPQHAR